MTQNIFLRASGYYLRYIVPTHQRHLLRTRELRYTLNTSTRKVAKKRARAVVGRVDILLDQLGQGFVVLNNKQIQDTVRGYIQEAQSGISDSHLISPPGDDNENEAHVGILLDDLRGLEADLASSDFSDDIEAKVCELFQVPADTTDRDDLQFKRACRELTKATVLLWEDHLKRLSGEPTADDTPYLASPSAQPLGQPTAAQKGLTGPRISEVIEDFIADRIASKGIRANTQVTYREHVRAFVDVLGDRHVAGVVRDDVTTLRDTLSRLPKNRNRLKAYRDKTVAELLKMDIPEGSTPHGRTISEVMAGLRAVFQWLKVGRVIDQNPFEGVSVLFTSKSYTAFAPDDLQAIFSSTLYQPDSAYCRRKTTTAGYWWLPLLALYSGARPSELVQMRLEDINAVDGVLVAKVKEDEETGQQVKTPAGQRTFPIHPRLIQLGFGEYIDKLKQAGADRVLQGITKGKRKAGDQAGKWFNERYRTDYLPAGLREDRKTLYSFRHTFITQALNLAGMQLEYVQQIVGHERSQMGATKHYDKGAGPERLLKEIEKVGFECDALNSLGQDWRNLPLYR